MGDIDMENVEATQVFVVISPYLWHTKDSV